MVAYDPHPPANVVIVATEITVWTNTFCCMQQKKCAHITFIQKPSIACCIPGGFGADALHHHKIDTARSGHT